MWIKVAIFINFIALVISLFSSLFIVYNDKGQSKKPLIALSIRVGLALSLMALIGYGIASGQLGKHDEPWNAYEIPKDGTPLNKKP